MCDADLRDARRQWPVRRVLALLGVALATSACTRTLDTARPQHFLERNYVFATRGDTTNLYEAHTAAHLFLIDGLESAYDRMSGIPGSLPPAGSPWSDTAKVLVRHAEALRLVLSPMFRIRQMKDSSAAVRTPSFMPRLLLEGLSAHGLGKPRVLGSNVEWRHVWLTGVRVSLTHHSNGQAGCFRQGYRHSEADFDTCEPRPITDPGAVLSDDTLQVRLNGSDGDFSSTYASLLWHNSYLYLGGNGVVRGRAGVMLGVDWHPPGIFGALSQEQRDLYGGWRMRGQAEGLWHSVLGRTRLTVEGERGPRASGPLAARFSPRILPWRGSIEIAHTVDQALGTGLFVRWNDGQDYYNIGFADRHRVLMYGIVLDVAGLDRVTKQ